MRPVVALSVAALMATVVFTSLTLADTPQPKKAPAKTKTAQKAPPAKRSGATAVTTRKVVIPRKKVKARWVRVNQVVRKPARPSYQTHPDPERYQQIQQALADSGYFKGEVNGQWNDDSVAALRHFQADKKLPTDGKISALSLIGLGLGPRRDIANASAPVNGPAVVPTPASAITATPAPTLNDATPVPPPALPNLPPN